MTRTLTVLVPHPLGLRTLEPYPQLRGLLYDPSQPPTSEQQEAEVIVVDQPADSDAPAFTFVGALPRLALVQTLNAGYEQWIGRVPPGVRLSNARGAHGRAVAEWIVAVLLGHYRRLPRFAAAQAGHTWDHEITPSLEGRRVSVLGAGDIGGTVAQMLAPFRCDVSLVARTSRPGVLDMDGFRRVLPAQDAVVLALPLSDETRRVVDAAFLAAMGDDAVLVNAGRGALVDTDALLAATATGRIAAILDVTDPEPLPPDHPLWDAPGVTITPHVSGSTAGLWARAWQVAVTQIDVYSRGQAPPNLVL